MGEKQQNIFKRAWGAWKRFGQKMAELVGVAIFAVLYCVAFAPMAVVLKLIYGVKEFGAVLPCSRCTHAERVLRKVAAQFEDSVLVEKVDIASEEAAQYGVLLPPAVLVDNELLASGQGVSEGRLQKAVQEHLNRA